jgi:hypothetical protein
MSINLKLLLSKTSSYTIILLLILLQQSCKKDIISNQNNLEQIESKKTLFNYASIDNEDLRKIAYTIGESKKK